MNYTCTIYTDYIDPTKKEEILERCAKIISRAVQSHEADKRGNKNEKKDS
jgi:hypothetical protein